MTNFGAEGVTTHELTPAERTQQGFQAFDDRVMATHPDFKPGDMIVFDTEVEGEPVRVMIDSFPFMGEGMDFHQMRRVFFRQKTMERYVYTERMQATAYTPKGSQCVLHDIDATVALALTLEELLQQVDQNEIELRVRKADN